VHVYVHVNVYVYVHVYVHVHVYVYVYVHVNVHVYVYVYVYVLVSARIPFPAVNLPRLRRPRYLRGQHLPMRLRMVRTAVLRLYARRPIQLHR